MVKMKTEKVIYDGDELLYTLTNIDKKVIITFVKNETTYNVEVEQKSMGMTTMTDYYKYGEILTYNEFKELEVLINITEGKVSKFNFNNG